MCHNCSRMTVSSHIILIPGSLLNLYQIRPWKYVSRIVISEYVHYLVETLAVLLYLWTVILTFMTSYCANELDKGRYTNLMKIT